jgi:GTP-binding protein Era
MTEEGRPQGFKSGFVTLIGRPNSGKSTLLNHILGEKIAIISDKPQTTRNRILGIKNLPAGQIVFFDTPGIHRGRSRFNQSLVRIALATYSEVDAICFLIEATDPENQENDYILETLEKCQKPILLVINKIDLVSKNRLLPVMQQFGKLGHFAQIIPISALQKDGLETFLGELLQLLPEGPRLFPEDMTTDQTERFLVSELIREKVYLLTRQEIPYATAVVVETFKEKEERNLILIQAAIHVERESQKGVLIGNRGKMLKEIGKLAREEIETILGARVFLELWVKVEKNWREDPRALREMGYS